MYAFEVVVRAESGTLISKFFARAHTWYSLRDAVKARYALHEGKPTQIDYFRFDHIVAAGVVDEPSEDKIMLVVDDKGNAKWKAKHR